MTSLPYPVSRVTSRLPLTTSQTAITPLGISLAMIRLPSGENLNSLNQPWSDLMIPATRE